MGAPGNMERAHGRHDEKASLSTKQGNREGEAEPERAVLDQRALVDSIPRQLPCNVTKPVVINSNDNHCACDDCISSPIVADTRRLIGSVRFLASPGSTEDPGVEGGTGGHWVNVFGMTPYEKCHIDRISVSGAGVGEMLNRALVASGMAASAVIEDIVFAFYQLSTSPRCGNITR